MNPLRALEAHGQSVWLDFLARRFVVDGSLKALVERDGLKGVTSNPAIFEKAIEAGAEYDDALRAALRERDRSPIDLYEHLAVADIQSAADVLRPVYDASDGRDGFVSLEVSPYLAMDTEATMKEARRLWRAVRRDNVMIKVPATDAGLPAIRHLLGEGVNINITLLFAHDVYETVAEAYLAGAENFAEDGGDLKKLASVASFFVSRIDTAVEKLIDERRDNTLASLKGKVAIANAKLAYRRYKRLFSGARWDRLSANGARPQRLLWASTGTKNKAYSDVHYVENLIGRDTVDTVPPATMDAFRDHGKTADTLDEGMDDAAQILATLEKGGISLDALCRKLVVDGVRLFADAADNLLAAIERKRVALLEGRHDEQHWSVPPSLLREVDGAADEWRAGGKVRRLWAHDQGLWTGADEASWLGWLDIVAAGAARAEEWRSFAAEVKRDNFSHVVLLGMGGSSLGPEVIGKTFGHQQGFPELLVLDSTDPAQIRAVASRAAPARTLHIVSSKSGTTLEPNILMEYFFARAENRGQNFIAITDPGSKIEDEAKRRKFRRIFHGSASIGGRYSVLSDFGLVPAAAVGVDVPHFLEAASLMVRSCGPDVPPAENPGVALGLVLGLAAKAGRDKATIIATPALADFGAWLEQLLAESTGKEGRGIIPVDGEPLGAPQSYGADRVFIDLRLAAEQDQGTPHRLEALARAGHPVLRFVVADRTALGQEFFRWEIATAVAGAVIGIDPFDQPDVEASKVKTRELTALYEKSGRLPDEQPLFEGSGITLYADARNAAELCGRSLTDVLAAHFGRLGAGDYCAFLAYVERNAAHAAALTDMRAIVRDRKRVATCVGFGPRFLHSTGQAYKGGPPSGVFVQITADDAQDLAVPGQKLSFGIVKAAQARGDFEVLAERGRRLLRVHLGADVAAGLAVLEEAVGKALG